MIEASVSQVFERYERVFNQALGGDTDVREAAALDASCLISATPPGVMTGRTNEQLKQVMAQGYTAQRAIGTKEVSIRDGRSSPIDEHNCVAHVEWTATYARKEPPNVATAFDVPYFVRTIQGKSKVFAWVSGDEQALLREHG